ncbi:MAG: outer membrane lipoprotein chaperone LolA [Acidobacteriota bacterium]|nr:outer membrane lipoprotein chaperone LolA [Acidobacteriota bacterium]
MNRFALWCILLCAPLAAAPSDLDARLHRIEDRYNHAKSLTLDFSETYAGKGHPVQNESGVLYLKKPGRMRWQYTEPAGKLFLSDGKEVYLYTPEARKAEKGRLKESEDMRAPLAFLLGKLDFSREFKSFEMRPDGANNWIVAQPKSANLAYSKVEFLTLPSGEIRSVKITGQDQSKLDFMFSNERMNVPVAASLFTFQVPPGVQVVEAER